jgi:hypothetical protein
VGTPYSELITRIRRQLKDEASYTDQALQDALTDSFGLCELFGLETPARDATGFTVDLSEAQKFVYVRAAVIALKWPNVIELALDLMGVRDEQLSVDVARQASEARETLAAELRYLQGMIDSLLPNIRSFPIDYGVAFPEKSPLRGTEP